MSGATSRSKGNRWEAAVAQLLRDYGWHALTSRNARGGSQQGEDIITDAPVLIEAKNCKTIALAGWMDQAIAEADGAPEPAAVFIKRRGKRAEHGYAVMRIDQYLHLLRKADM
jgi:hypothetical protein